MNFDWYTISFNFFSLWLFFWMYIKFWSMRACTKTFTFGISVCGLFIVVALVGIGCCIIILFYYFSARSINSRWFIYKKINIHGRNHCIWYADNIHTLGVWWCNSGTYVHKISIFSIFRSPFRQFKMFKWFNRRKIIDVISIPCENDCEREKKTAVFKSIKCWWFLSFSYFVPLLNCSNRSNDYAYWWFNSISTSSPPPSS